MATTVRNFFERLAPTLPAPGQPKPRVIEKDLGIGALKRVLNQLQTQPITVGLQGASGATHHPGTKDASIAQVAAWQEYGTPGSDDRQYDQPRRHIPSRPFLRTAFAKYQIEIRAQIQRALSGVIDARTDLEAAQDGLGLAAVGFVRQTIDDAKSWATPLAESTVDRKGHDYPLVESHTMREAVSYAVRDGETIVRQGGEE